MGSSPQAGADIRNHYDTIALSNLGEEKYLYGNRAGHTVAGLRQQLRKGQRQRNYSTAR